MKTPKFFKALLVLTIVFGCAKEKKLPILGETSVNPETGALVYYKAPEFSLTNQLNQLTNNKTFADKILVVDFFFTSCPSICPQMTKHLKLVEEAYQYENKVAIVSFSIDAENDTPDKLQEYAKAYEINNEKWTFLTGDSDAIFELSKDYKVRAFEDNNWQGRNLLHDGTFVLVDGKRRIRGYYNGLDQKDIQRLIVDIKKLLNES